MEPFVDDLISISKEVSFDKDKFMDKANSPQTFSTEPNYD